MSLRAVALYLRLSQEDDAKGESSSISGQRCLLYDYISSDKVLAQMPVMEFVDDGYSGTNFNRPGIQKLLEKVKAGEIACILVKDLSRFGRNYLEAGNYLEQVFPFMGVRFIAVNDQYDSADYCGTTGDLSIPFRNLLHDLYSKDISQKVKSAKKTKMQRGDFLSAYAPYGYQKSPQGHNRLVVDEVAAQVVRQIFAEINAGKSTSAVARALNAQHVPTPMQYKAAMGVSRRFNSGSTNNVWTKEAVLRIIRDVRYTGHCINGKQKITVAGSKKAVSTPKDEWIVIEGTHEQLVTTALFESANAQIAAKSKRKPQEDKARLFSKKLKCAHCGLLLRRKAATEPYYYCATVRMADTGCVKKHLLENEMGRLLMAILQRQWEAATDLTQLMQTMKKNLQDEMLDVMSQIKKLTAESKKVEADKFKSYQKYCGTLDKVGYLQKKSRLEAQQLQVKAKTEKLTDQVVFLRQRLAKCEGLPKSFYAPYTAPIQREYIDALICDISVYQEKRFEITFNFYDPFIEGLCNQPQEHLA